MSGYSIQWFRKITSADSITITNLYKIMKDLEKYAFDNFMKGFKLKSARPSQQFVQSMIDREIELRDSELWQQKMADTEDLDHTDWLDVVDELQRSIVKEFKFDDIEYGLNVLRSASREYDLERLPNYIKFNRAKKGNLIIGSDAPNPTVLKCDDLESVNLYDVEDKRIQFVFAGALT